ncbi:MAG: 4-(cytidine 5'-diphospho)-2-C-methyl-D-erythritol kinase [Flavobacteriales bacterium]|nr:4-(cytidine 5'-diphospho)-2-C-methyl-D-erythritol kinase [Flavobacteriales bacterium]
MLRFPQAKINLGLNVLARRPDGYHDIESVLVPIPLTDVLEAVLAPELGVNGLEYTRSGLPIPGPVETDLCFKAVRRLQGDQDLPGLRLHLHKVVPMGAGLGGGSSDGASTLELVNTLCGLHLNEQQLADHALALGSDCPFFLQDQVCIARGRGERLIPVDIDLNGLWLILANPGVHVGTAEVYRNTEPTERDWRIESVLRREFQFEWEKTLPNTMEPYVLRTYSEVNALKRELQRAGAFYTAMSGSGSSVFGLFTEEPVMPAFTATTRAWKLPL